MYKVYSKHYYIYWEYIIIFCLKYVTDILTLYRYSISATINLSLPQIIVDSHILLIQGAHTEECLCLLVMLCLANCLA